MTIRDCAPSCRSRSSRRRAVSPASTRRAREAAQLLDPRPQLGLEPLVLERQRRGRRGGAHELRLVVQSRVVGDRGDPPAAHVDLRPARAGHRDRMPERVDVALRLRQPVRECHRRITERVGQRGPQRALAGRLPDARDQLGHRLALREPAAQEPREEPERDGRHQRLRDQLERVVRRAGRVEPLGHHERRDGEAARPQHRPPRPAARLRALAPDDDDPAHGDQGDRDRVLHGVQRVRERLVALHDQQVARLARLLEQQRRHLEHGHGEVGRGDHRALGTRVQPSGGEGEQQVTEDRREQPVEQLPDRVQHVAVRGREAGPEPREAGRGHQQPGAIAGPPPPREQARADERPADEQAEAGDEPAVVDVAAREDDRRVRDAGREAGDREEGYSPTARFGASPQSCSRR